MKKKKKIPIKNKKNIYSLLMNDREAKLIMFDVDFFFNTGWHSTSFIVWE